jgi:subtilisin family serine protease
MADNGHNGSGDTGAGTMADAGADATAGQHTGRHLVLLDPDAMDAGMSALSDAAGIAAAEHADVYDVEATVEALAAGSPVVLDEIGVAVVPAEPDQQQALTRAALAAPQVTEIEPERIVTISQDLQVADYLRGYRAGVDALVERVLEAGLDGATAAAAALGAWDETHATWGLQATRVVESCWSGGGVKLAVLDTGCDLNHADFAGRSIATASFIRGEDVQDGHGHGTHCIGTACGPKAPATGPRYGVAHGAEIFAGKVLSNRGSGADGGILAGINWAVGRDCQVISMSLGAPTQIGSRHSAVYEAVARRALRRGTVIVAAAGNESRRPGTVNPVGHPANCPSILAVAALTPGMAVAPFSCAGLNPDGGQIDIAAPGVKVLSSWPGGYRSLQGTSMATPHVAGILALLAQANPSATAGDLTTRVLSGALRLPLPSVDVGAGLAQAPV